MASTTLTTIRQRLLRELDLGILIPNAKFDSAAVTSITSADLMRNTRWTANHFSQRNTVIFRPGSATAADNIRYAGDLNTATGALSHTGANYADTTVTSEVPELWYDGVRPDLEILDAINRALEFVNVRTFIPISHGGDLDYDMSISTDTNWTNVGTPSTSAKSTTARRTPYGLRSYQLVNNGVANEGTQSATLPAVPERSVKAFAIASVNVGTASMQFYDVTGSAAFPTAAVTSSEEEPMLLEQTWQAVPASCREMAVRLLGTTTTSDVYWNGLWVYKQDNLRLNLPSFLDEEFNLPSVFQGRPRFAIDNHVWDAQSLDMVELKKGREFDYIAHHADANPYAIVVRDSSVYEYPLFVQASRPYSDLGALSAEADTTNCPLHLLMPMVKIRVLNDVLLPRQPSNPVWLAKLAEANLEWRQANDVRQVKSVAHRPYFHGVRV